MCIIMLLCACCGGWSASGSQVSNVVSIPTPHIYPHPLSQTCASMCMLWYVDGPIYIMMSASSPPHIYPHPTPRLVLPCACYGGWSASGSQASSAVSIITPPHIYIPPPPDLCFHVHVVVDGLQVDPRCIVLSASSPFLSPHPPPPYPQTHTSICMLWWMVCKWIPGA